VGRKIAIGEVEKGDALELEASELFEHCSAGNVKVRAAQNQVKSIAKNMPAKATGGSGKLLAFVSAPKREGVKAKSSNVSRSSTPKRTKIERTATELFKVAFRSTTGFAKLFFSVTSKHKSANSTIDD